MQEIRFVRCAPDDAEAVIDLDGIAAPGARASIDLAPVYHEHGERWKRAFVEWLGALNVRQASRGWWAHTSSAKNFLSSPLGNAIFQVLAVESTLRRLGAGTVHVVGATPGQIATLQRHFRRRGAEVRIAQALTAAFRPWTFLPRLAWHALRVVGVHILRGRTSPPVAQTCLLTYVDRGFKDGFDAFFGPLADLLAERTGERPLHVALIQAPWREMLPRLRRAGRYRYWPLFHELRLGDVGAAVADTLRAAWHLRPVSRAAGDIEEIDVAPLLGEALWWDLGPGGYFTNQLAYRAARRLAARIDPLRIIYPFEMKSLEKMFILGVRAAAPRCPLIGYQHAAITPRHTTFFLARNESAVTPLPDFVVTVGDVTREYLEAQGGYPADFFRTGGALRQKPQPVLPARSAAGRPLRLLLALSSSRRELIDAVTLLCALCDLRDDVEVGVRPHPEFPLALLPAALRAAVAKLRMRDFSGTPLAENLEWCDAAVYVSSTAALEALLVGRPIVTLRLGDAIEPDPLLGTPPLRLRAASLPELVTCCDELRALLVVGNASAREAAADYARRYLRPWTANDLAAFLESTAQDLPDAIILAKPAGGAGPS